MTNQPPCLCRGNDPADPCHHGDTAEGCPRHDPDPIGRAQAHQEHAAREALAQVTRIGHMVNLLNMYDQADGIDHDIIDGLYKLARKLEAI